LAARIYNMTLGRALIVLTLVMTSQNVALAEGVLTLQGAVERAVQVSRQVKKAKYDVRISTIGVQQDIALMSPRVTMGWNYAYYGSEVNVPFSTPQGPQEILIRPSEVSTGNLTLAQPITGLFGAFRKALVDGMAETISKTTLKATQSKIAFLAAQAYRQVQETEAVYDIARERVSISQKQAHDANVSFELGRFAKTDVLRLDMALGQAKIGLAGAKAAYEIAVSTFRDLLDYQPGETLLLEKLPKVEDIKVAIAVPDLMPAQDVALNARLDVKIAQVARKMAHDGAVLPLATLIPDVNVFARWDENFSNIGTFGVKSQFSIGLMLNWNLWDGGARFLSFKEGRLRMHKASLDLIDATRNANLEVQKALASLIAAQDTLELQKVNVAQAEEVHRGSSIRFSNGAVNITDFVLSEDALNRARVDLAKSLTDLDTKNMLLQQAMGQERPSSIF
jgi:outer membrane protein